MPIPRAIRLLNPASPSYGFRADFVQLLQDLMDYAHPRFYAALVAIEKEKSRAEKKAMQLLLQKEVMYLLKYVGVATAAGLPVAVPLILRSLADSMAFAAPEEFPLPIDGRFLSWLGATFYTVIPTHAMDWWSTKSARKISNHHLNDASLAFCIEQFRKQKPPQTYIKIPSPAHGLPKDRCDACREIQIGYVNSLDALIKASETVNARKVVAQADALQSRRRMASALELFNLATQKAIAAAGGPQAPADSGRMAVDTPPRQVGPERQTADPPPNDKSQWLFGSTLTENDILATLGSEARKSRAWTKRRGEPHSGYFWQHAQGRLNPDGFSESQKSVGTMNSKDFIPLAASANHVPPPTDQCFPKQFSPEQYRLTPSIQSHPQSEGTVRALNNTEEVQVAATTRVNVMLDMVRSPTAEVPGLAGIQAGDNYTAVFDASDNIGNAAAPPQPVNVSADEIAAGLGAMYNEPRPFNVPLLQSIPSDMAALFAIVDKSIQPGAAASEVAPVAMDDAPSAAADDAPSAAADDAPSAAEDAAAAEQAENEGGPLFENDEDFAQFFASFEAIVPALGEAPAEIDEMIDEIPSDSAMDIIDMFGSPEPLQAEAAGSPLTDCDSGDSEWSDEKPAGEDIVPAAAFDFSRLPVELFPHPDGDDDSDDEMYL